MTTTSMREEAPPGDRMQTIGAVCARLRQEFPDVSISKIRYLEDQGLIAPRRTPGGYRLFSEEDVERLRTILRLQRDEFLPLRVIRQQLSSPLPSQRRGRPLGVAEKEEELDLAALCARARISADLARDLEEFGLIEPLRRRGERRYAPIEADIAALCGQLAAFGMSARHLRAFRLGADRAAGLVEQVVAPSLRARSIERRRAGLDQLQSLSELASSLTQLLLWRALRRLAAG
ncbi:MAG: MerR family transcriptional regulator [Thermoleophilia bacterium]